MKFLRGTSIRKKIIIIIMLTSSITLLAASLSYVIYDGLRVRQGIRDDLLSLAEIIGINTSAAIMFNDVKAAQKNLATLRDHPHIYAAYIIVDKTIFAQYIAEGTDKKRLKKLFVEQKVGAYIDTKALNALLEEANSLWDFDLDLEAVRKIKLDGEEIGTIVIQSYLLDMIIERMRWFIFLVLFITVGAFFLAFVISAKLQGRIADPILKLVQIMKTISDNKTYSVRAVKVSNDEVGTLYDGFNEMLADIQKRDEKLDEYHIHLKEEIVARTKASDEWRATFDATREIIFMLDGDFAVLKANRAGADFLGKPYGEIMRRPIDELLQDAGFSEEMMLLALMQKTKQHEEKEIYWPEKEQWLILSLDPVRDERNEVNAAVLIIRDTTNVRKAEDEQRKLRAQLRQIQKMDSVGRLAGGIAHDFNNILSSILGYSELAMMQLSEQDPLKEKLKIIHSSGEKAAALTRQLLLFSRKEAAEMKAVNLGAVIESMMKMLVRLIGEDLRLEVRIQPQLAHIHADSGQLEQVLMNLVVNARDSMTSGGTITISAENRLLPDDQPCDVEAGAYVVMTISDTGEGMSREVQEKMFEPFFTTKPVGKGTGLGLSTVYGIVQHHGAYARVQSEMGKGTTFRIYFPISKDTVERGSVQGSVMETRGSETILIAEDDINLRTLSRAVLEDCGYLVIEAVDGEDAVLRFIENRHTVQLLLLDVIMPKKNGKEAYWEIKKIRPEIKTLFISGYTADIISPYGIVEEGIELIQKPISRADLLTRVRTILDK